MLSGKKARRKSRKSGNQEIRKGRAEGEGNNWEGCARVITDRWASKQEEESGNQEIRKG
jgi:hypothetical protein